jgi:xanthine dehydrogenase accessory factor
MSGMPLSARTCIERLAVTTHPVVMITLVAGVGSIPQDIGARMLVDAGGRLEGSVGGGKLEQHAIAEAQRWLAAWADGPADTTTAPCALHEWNLQRDIGMTCGGVVTLLFEAYHVAPWRVVLFGAGHVAQALVRVLTILDCVVVCVDSRQEWLDRLPTVPSLTPVLREVPATWVDQISDRDMVLCMTMGHATDVPILRSLYAAGRVPAFIGVIGSEAKRKAMTKQLRGDGVDDDWLQRVQCPVGLPIGGNQPGEIAVSVAAALIAQRHGQELPRA